MTAAEDAISQLLSMIATQEIKRGQRLPRETELATRLGVSRNSLREGIRALGYTGVLDIRHGDGTYVGLLDPTPLFASLGVFADVAETGGILQLFELRRILESAATAKAASRIGRDDLDQLADLVETISRTDSPEECVRADAEFHGLIVRAAGNPVMTSLLAGLESSTLRHRLWHATSNAGAIERSNHGHRTIVAALAAGDAELAAAASAAHIADGEFWLRRTMDLEQDEQKVWSDDGR